MFVLQKSSYRQGVKRWCLGCGVAASPTLEWESLGTHSGLIRESCRTLGGVICALLSKMLSLVAEAGPLF